MQTCIRTLYDVFALEEVYQLERFLYIYKIENSPSD
ncbi:hypothetical protein NIES4073_05890 [Kalymmatonema gypsitolerans NIES-4073]|nr:hypothetical protein NIES4073_05890 [Scytonema sp. NIES-4073]